MSQIAHTALSALVCIYICKNSFHFVFLYQRCSIVLLHKWSRSQVYALFAYMPPCLFFILAFVRAHHLSRKLKALCHYPG